MYKGLLFLFAVACGVVYLTFLKPIPGVVEREALAKALQEERMRRQVEDDRLLDAAKDSLQQVTAEPVKEPQTPREEPGDAVVALAAEGQGDEGPRVRSDEARVVEASFDAPQAQQEGEGTAEPRTEDVSSSAEPKLEPLLFRVRSNVSGLEAVGLVIASRLAKAGVVEVPTEGDDGRVFAVADGERLREAMDVVLEYLKNDTSKATRLLDDYGEAPQWAAQGGIDAAILGIEGERVAAFESALRDYEVVGISVSVNVGKEDVTNAGDSWYELYTRERIKRPNEYLAGTFSGVKVLTIKSTEELARFAEVMPVKWGVSAAISRLTRVTPAVKWNSDEARSARPEVDELPDWFLKACPTGGDSLERLVGYVRENYSKEAELEQLAAAELAKQRLVVRPVGEQEWGEPWRALGKFAKANAVGQEAARGRSLVSRLEFEGEEQFLRFISDYAESDTATRFPLSLVVKEFGRIYNAPPWLGGSSLLEYLMDDFQDELEDAEYEYREWFHVTRSGGKRSVWRVVQDVAKAQGVIRLSGTSSDGDKFLLQGEEQTERFISTMVGRLGQEGPTKLARGVAFTNVESNAANTGPSWAPKGLSSYIWERERQQKAKRERDKPKRSAPKAKAPPRNVLQLHEGAGPDSEFYKELQRVASSSKNASVVQKRGPGKKLVIEVKGLMEYKALITELASTKKGRKYQGAHFRVWLTATGAGGTGSAPPAWTRGLVN